jgi:hypothetical protein
VWSPVSKEPSKSESPSLEAKDSLRKCILHSSLVLIGLITSCVPLDKLANFSALFLLLQIEIKLSSTS